MPWDDFRHVAPIGEPGFCPSLYNGEYQGLWAFLQPTEFTRKLNALVRAEESSVSSGGNGGSLCQFVYIYFFPSPEDVFPLQIRTQQHFSTFGRLNNAIGLLQQILESSASAQSY